MTSWINVNHSRPPSPSLQNISGFHLRAPRYGGQDGGPAPRAPLPRDFYRRPTLDVARDLLGKILVHQSRGQVAAGRIVEVEAYIGESDPACHAAPGPTPRNRPLYGPSGHAYVYLNYGIHYLVNAVTEDEGFPAAVLIRALEPLEGISLMRRRRGFIGHSAGDHLALCRGPGNLSRALGITLGQNCLDLTGSRLRIEDDGCLPQEIAWSGRIGIRVGVEREWRCYVAGNAAVSMHRVGAGLVPPPHRAQSARPGPRPAQPRATTRVAPTSGG